MMGHRQVEQAALFYEFSLEKHIPADHLLRSVDRFVDLRAIRRDLAPFYSSIGRPSIDPELMIRMLLIGYCFGIRSERRLCDEVHLNLAYRWFCRLGLDGVVPDHSTFPKNRHGRFRQSDLFRRVFESVLRRCIEERLVGGDGFAVDASLIKADANRQKGIEGDKGLPPEAAGRAIDEYLAVLDDAAFGAATEVTPKFVSPSDPAARWTGAHGGQAFFAYSTNYLIDIENAIIVDVEASTAIRQAEVKPARRPTAGHVWTDEVAIRKMLAWPFEGLLFDVENNALWWPEWGNRPTSPNEREDILRSVVSRAPKLIPLIAHRFLPEQPHERGNPVFSVHQSDVIYYGATLP